MIQRSDGNRKKLAPPGIPVVPEIDPAWIKALNNSTPGSVPAPTAAVSPYKYTSVRQADDAMMQKYFKKYPLAEKYMEQNNGQMSTKPESLVDGKRYGVYDAGKWGGAYDKLVGTNRILDFAIGDPIKSLFKNTLSGKNADTTFNPNSGASWDQRLGAFTEDALNVANLIPAAGAVDDAARSGVPAFKNWITSLAEKRAANIGTGEGFSLANKLKPTASLDNYILHGGVEPERLVGGVIDPSYVRGGDKFIRNDVNPMSVKHGPNALEDAYFLDAELKERAVLASDVGAAEKAKSQAWLDKHEDILARIKAGEDHGSGVGRLDPWQTYRAEGGMYLLDVPSNLRSRAAISPAGEVQFWGEQKPVGFVRHNQNVGAFGSKQAEDKAIFQMMVDDADIKAIQKQKLANMLARARGTQITPGYKQFAQETFDKFLNKSFPIHERNPNFGQPGQGLEFFAKFPSEYVPRITNYDQITSKLSRAKTEKEVFALLDELIPHEQLYDSLRTGFTEIEGGLPELKREIVDMLAGINSDYPRLKSVPRNGPIIVNNPQTPAKLPDWTVLMNSGDGGQKYAFANKFMDRRTPSEIIDQVYDEDLWKLMFKDRKAGQQILDQRLAQLGYK
jgi:hypothetical protein